MDAVTIRDILTRAGYHVFAADAGTIVLEDPACIYRAFTNFIDFAWITLGFLTGLLLFGWGISMIRGADVKNIENIKNMALLFGALSVVPGILSFMIGNDILQCRKVVVPVAEINNVLALKNLRFDEEIDERYMIMAAEFAEEEATADVRLGSRRICTGTMRQRHRTFQVVDAATTLLPADIRTFQNVAREFNFRYRMHDSAGRGYIASTRIYDSMPFHEGTDFLMGPGTAVPAMFAGRVSRIAREHGGFNGLSITNDNGTVSHYLYAAAVPGLSVGDRVTPGQIIARVEDMSRNPSYRGIPNHLHFELWSGTGRRSGNLINPERLLYWLDGAWGRENCCFGHPYDPARPCR